MYEFLCHHVSTFFPLRHRWGRKAKWKAWTLTKNDGSKPGDSLSYLLWLQLFRDRDWWIISLLCVSSCLFFVFLSLVPVLGTLHNNLHNHFCGAGSVLHTVSQSTTTTWSTIKISIWYVWINTNTAAFFPRDKLCVSWNQILSVHALPACLGNPETRCRLALWVWPFSTLLLLVYYLQFFSCSLIQVMYFSTLKNGTVTNWKRKHFSKFCFVQLCVYCRLKILKEKKRKESFF